MPPPSDFTPAKRGDLVLLPQTSSATYADFRTERRTRFAFAKVNSVTREGRIKGAERSEPAPWPWRFGGGSTCHVIAAAKLNGKSADDVLAAIYANTKGDFDSVDAARAAILAVVNP